MKITVIFLVGLSLIGCSGIQEKTASTAITKRNISSTLGRSSKCEKPSSSNVKNAFRLIEAGETGLCQLLQTNAVSKAAHNSECETMYHLAIRAHNQDAITCLKSKNFNILFREGEGNDNKKTNESKRPFLEYVVKHGSLDFIKKSNFDFRIKSISEVALFASMDRSGIAVFKYVMAQIAYVNTTIGFIGRLMGRRLDINAMRSRYGMEVLVHAVMYNENVEVTEHLLRAGADENAANAAGRTVLMSAAIYNKNVEVIKALLRADVEVNAVNIYGDTALMFSAEYNENVEVSEALLAADAKVRVKDNRGQTVLMRAARHNNNVDVTKLFLRPDIKIDAVDNEGYTALMHAVEYNRNIEVTKALLAADANRNIVGIRGDALTIAKNAGNEAFVRLLRKR